LSTGGNIVGKQKRRLTQGNQYELLWHGGGGGAHLFTCTCASPENDWQRSSD